MPVQFNLDGSGVTTTGANGKLLTFKFPATTGVDSSWYLFCYASTSPWTGGTLQDGFFVGILSSCYDAGTNSASASTGTPCVAQQSRGLPGSPDATKIVAKIWDPLDSKYH
jgi:hypothetical protein